MLKGVCRASPPGPADIELIIRVVEPPKPADSKAVGPAPSMGDVAPARPAAGVKDTRTWTARVFDHFEALRVRVRNMHGDAASDIAGAHIEVEGPYGSVMQVRGRGGGEAQRRAGARIGGGA